MQALSNAIENKDDFGAPMAVCDKEDFTRELLNVMNEDLDEQARFDWKSFLQLAVIVTLIYQRRI